MTKPWAEAIGLCWKAVTVALAVWLVSALPGAGAAGASLPPLAVVKQHDSLAVSTQLGSGLFSSVQEAITSGIPAHFSYEIEVWLRNRLWSDKSIVKKAIERVVRFNSLSKEYQVAESGGEASWERTSKNLEEVKGWVTRVETFPLVKLSDLAPAETYYVRARATVKTEQSPSTLKYMFFFLPKAKKTGWERSEPFQLEELRAAVAPQPGAAPSAARP